MVSPETRIALPVGVVYRKLDVHEDERGSLMEIFRVSWDSAALEPVQWNFVRSAAGVLRGVHLHLVHSDYLVALQGRIIIGLSDLRKNSPTNGTSAVVPLEAANAILIPPGVAHGFYFPEPSLHVYGVSHTWNAADELGCQWNDSELRLAWPCTAPILSERDKSLPSLNTLVKGLPAAI